MSFELRFKVFDTGTNKLADVISEQNGKVYFCPYSVFNAYLNASDGAVIESKSIGDRSSFYSLPYINTTNDVCIDIMLFNASKSELEFWKTAVLSVGKALNFSMPPFPSCSFWLYVFFTLVAEQLNLPYDYLRRVFHFKEHSVSQLTTRNGHSASLYQFRRFYERVGEYPQYQMLAQHGVIKPMCHNSFVKSFDKCADKIEAFLQFFVSMHPAGINNFVSLLERISDSEYDNLKSISEKYSDILVKDKGEFTNLLVHLSSCSTKDERVSKLISSYCNFLQTTNVKPLSFAILHYIFRNSLDIASVFDSCICDTTKLSLSELNKTVADSNNTFLANRYEKIRKSLLCLNGEIEDVHFSISNVDSEEMCRIWHLCYCFDASRYVSFLLSIGNSSFDKKYYCLYNYRTMKIELYEKTNDGYFSRFDASSCTKEKLSFLPYYIDNVLMPALVNTKFDKILNTSII